MISEQLKRLEEELTPYNKVLSKAADSILAEEISKYPIFIVHQQELTIGIPLIDREKVVGNWSVNASTLEEFFTKSLIKPDKIDSFKDVYKDPEAQLCLFVLSEMGATFIFVPRN